MAPLSVGVKSPGGLSETKSRLLFETKFTDLNEPEDRCCNHFLPKFCQSLFPL